MREGLETAITVAIAVVMEIIARRPREYPGETAITVAIAVVMGVAALSLPGVGLSVAPAGVGWTVGSLLRRVREIGSGNTPRSPRSGAA